MAYLKEVLHAFRIVAVALPTDSLHFLDLSSLAGSLDILEVDIRILAEVYNTAQEVEETCKQARRLFRMACMMTSPVLLRNLL